jgi:CRP-like cAMP-binding protein
VTATRAEIAAIVADHPLFRGLSAGHVDTIAGDAALRHFAAGEVVLREGEPADTVRAVVAGLVAVELYVPGRGASTIDTVGPGDVLGLSWLFPPYRNEFDARVVEPTVVIDLDAARLRAACDADHSLGYEVLSAMAAVLVRRLRSARLRFLDLYDDERARPR